MAEREGDESGGGTWRVNRRGTDVDF